MNREAYRSAAKLLGLAAADLSAAASALERAGLRQGVGRLRGDADHAERLARRAWQRAGNGQTDEEGVGS